MTGWIKLDDNFYRGPKLRGLTREVIASYVISICYAHEWSTDGFIPRAALDDIAPRKGAGIARSLVASRLWIEADGGWEIHDYHCHQQTKAQVDASRKAGAARQSRFRERHSNAVTDVPRNASVPPLHPGESREEVEKRREEPPLTPPPSPNGLVLAANGHSSAKLTEPKRIQYPPDFERVWRIYPRTEGKGAALKAWKNALKHATPADILESVNGYVNAWVANRTAEQYIPHFSKWLNDARYDDPPPRVTPRRADVSDKQRRNDAILQGSLEDRS